MDFDKFAQLQQMTTRERLKVISTELVSQIKYSMDEDRKPTADQIADGMVENKSFELSFDEQMIIGNDFVLYIKNFVMDNKHNPLLNFKLSRIVSFMEMNFSIELNIIFTKQIKDVVGMTDIISSHVNNNNLTKYTRRLKKK